MKIEKRAEIFTNLDELRLKLYAVLDATFAVVSSLLSIVLEAIENRKDSHSQNNSLMTIKDVAEYLRVNPRSVYQWVEKNDFPSLRAGIDLRFDKAEVDEWMKRDRKPIEPAPPLVVKFAASPDAAATRNKEQNGRTHI